MTAAPHAAADSGTRRVPRAPLCDAFTLTELLVVIALIVLLVSILLAALGHVQQKSREVTTLATMQAFSNACEAFQQEHGFYPGVVPEAIMVSDAAAGSGWPQISGTENASLHLLGGFARAADTEAAVYDQLADPPWTELSFATPGGGNPYLVKVDPARLGDGPTISGKPYAPYFTPSEKSFGVVEGQQGYGADLPDVLDAWGQPIIFLRRLRTLGPLAAEIGTTAPPQFESAAMQPYLQSEGLGSLAQNQKKYSVLVTAPDPEAALGRLLQHPALEGQARGSYLLLSAGADGIYFSRTDGAGSPGTPVDDVVSIYADNPNIFGEFDDVVIFGGGE